LCHNAAALQAAAGKSCVVAVIIGWGGRGSSDKARLEPRPPNQSLALPI
jgi:hypothetical protein